MTLEEAASSKAYTQKEMKDVYDDLKSPENKYKKKDLTLKFRVADEEEEIKTKIDEKMETKNTAKVGDYILTGTKGENYILPPEKFNSKYNIISGKAQTKPVEIKAKKFAGESIKFIASWKEEMICESGDFLVHNDGEYYRIEAGAFANTYEKV